MKVNYPGHVPINCFQRSLLAVGTGIFAYFNPKRADLIASLGEATASPFFIDKLRDSMLSDETGRELLRNKPRITSTSLNLNKLRKDLNEKPNTLGSTYIKWLDNEGVTPDSRANVKFIDNAECAYVMQRYRECHDFYHAITGLPIIIEGEIAVKAFEFFNFGLPMTALGSLLAPLRLKQRQRDRLYNIYFPWAIKNGLRAKSLINVYWERELDTDINELRRRLRIELPPNLRQLRAKRV